MASLTIAAGELAEHAVTLTATTVDTVTFAEDVDRVRVMNLNGAAIIYYTLDGSTPTVGGANTYVLPATICYEEHLAETSGNTAVKLISAGTPIYSVSKVTR